MAEKKKSTSKPGRRMSYVIDHAKESLKLFELLEKETLAKAKILVKLPSAKAREGKRITNEKIRQSLRKLGVVPLSEFNELRNRVQKLEETLATSRNQQVEDPDRNRSEALPQ
jgi:hypothetical protein